MSNGLVDVPGRVLPFEKIDSNNKHYNGGPEADWTKHVRALSLYSCATMKAWVIVTPRDNVNDVNIFVQTLVKAAQGMSFVLPRPYV